MDSGRSCRNGRRSWLRRRRATAAVATVSLAIAILPQRVSAQQALDCAVNGFCLSGGINSLLGLPNGTLDIVGYEPWDRILHPPTFDTPLAPQWRAAVSAWAPIEAEARAMLAGLHGVPNDFRLPHAAASDLRAQMLARLIAIAKRKAEGGTLTGAEQDALTAFEDLIVARRVQIAQAAISEYERWASNPCGYTVPLMPNGQSFGFEQYDPGPACQAGVPVTTGPPRPPTADQFKAYGAAVAVAPFSLSADRDAAWRDIDLSLTLMAGLAGAAAAGTLATVLAVSVPAVATAFATLAGSSAGFAFFTPTIVSGATFAATSAGVVGTTVAASLPAFVVIAVVVAAIYIAQFVEDQSILPELQATLTEAHARPDVWSLAQSSDTFGELLTVFLIPASPDWTAEERAGAETARRGPDAPLPGDPRFLVDGVIQDSIQTFNSRSELQETFMSQGWFVTRTRASNGTWGPWQWSLTLEYVPAFPATGTRLAGIQPDGFIDIARPANPGASPSAAVKTTQLQILDGSLQSRTVQWTGNRIPVLAPTVSEQPTVGSPVTFRANASDPDVGHSVVAIRWYIEDPTYDPLRKSVDECSLTPPGRIDPLTNLPYQCPWVSIDDNGDAGVTHTFARPGTWGVRVMAMDSAGGVSSQQFTINVANVAPELVITQIPFFALPPAQPSINEGQTASIVGTLDYPGLPGGAWGAITTLVVEWGDGHVTRRAYPCSSADVVDPEGQRIESDRTCVMNVGTGGAATTYEPLHSDPPLPAGPWPFQFEHTYVHDPTRPLPDPVQVKVYAVTNIGGRTDARRYNATVNNQATVLEAAPVCTFLPAGSPVLCHRLYGDHRVVPAGGDTDLRARLFDVPGSAHFATVLWGDGTSDATTVSCDGPLCPAATPNALGWDLTGGGQPLYFGFTKTYEQPGTYQVRLRLNDGAPGTDAAYDTTITVFGISTLSGPSQVRSGESAQYAVGLVTPAGHGASVTAACAGGTASNVTTTGFTCVFDDVAAPTTRAITLQAVMAGHTFSRTLDVNVLPPLPAAPNAPPTIGIVPNQTIRANATTGPISFSVDDADHVPATLVVTASSSNQAVVPDANLTLGGSGTARSITVTPAVGAHGVTTITLTVSDGIDTASTTFTVTVVDTSAHLAEGATGPFFDTEILLANPNTTEVPVVVTFLRDHGEPIALERALAPTSRTTIRVDEVPGLEWANFSTTVSFSSPLPIVVERTMSWDASGYGSHTETATGGSAPEWYFAEGAAGYFSTFFLLANPHATSNVARVTFYREGATEVAREYVLPPRSRTTIEASADPDLRFRPFAARIVFDLPGAAERAMYFGSDPLWQGGTASAGITAPATEWFVAEGATGSYFSTFLLLANPNATPVDVTLTYFPAGGPPVVRDVRIPARQRLTRNVALEDSALANAAVAARVTASLPIVVERSQYWGAGGWIEGHNSVGVPATATRWGFAEGRVGGPHGASTFVLLANPGTQEAQVTATFLRADGSTVVKTFQMAPERRFNIAIAGPGSDVPELADEPFGILIESTQPIVAERSLYMNAGGVMWASGTNAAGTVLP